MKQSEFDEINLFLEKYPNPRVMLAMDFDNNVELRLATPIDMNDPRPYSEYVTYYLIYVPMKKT